MRAPVARHVAFIMDGNRRWAEQRRDCLYNKEAVQAIFEAVLACKDRGVSYISLYAFSLENLARRDEQLTSYVFRALIDACTTRQHDFLAHSIKVRFVGVRSLYPQDVRCAVEELELITQEQSGITMQILFCYGSQQEIADAASRIARDVATGLLSVDAIKPELFSRYLWTSGIPSPDLIIRTGGVSRLSNFLMYQAAYSELVFLDCMWPEITQAVVHECIDTFEKVVRNFGV